MKFLEIIIPQYKEDDAVIDRLLSSINKQKNVDFNDIEITLINDASDVIISQELINKYNNLDIKYLKNDINMGVGPTRQRAVDQTESKYITFIDADDELYDENSLYVIFSCLKDTNADLVTTTVYNEKISDNGIVLVEKNYSPTNAFLHGKFIKREYLENNNVRFSNELRNDFEDAYYSMILVGSNPNNINAIHLNIPTYLWKFNQSSITRQNNGDDYFVVHINDWIKCYKLTKDELTKRNSMYKNYYIVDSIMTFYQLFNSNIFKNNKDLLE